MRELAMTGRGSEREPDAGSFPHVVGPFATLSPSRRVNAGLLAIFPGSLHRDLNVDLTRKLTGFLDPQPELP